METPIEYAKRFTGMFVHADAKMFAEAMEGRPHTAIFRNTEKDGEDLVDCMVEHHRDVEMGSAWPGCMCDEMCESCYPRFLVKNGDKEEYVIHKLPQAEYDKLKGAAAQ